MQRASTCVLALCGVPGSGKSRLASLIEQHASSLPDLLGRHICVDEFVALQDHQGPSPAAFSPEAWKEGREAALQALEGLLQKARGRPGPPYQLLIFDDTLHYRSMREECYRLAAKHGAAYVQLHLSCPLELAHHRNRQRPAAQQIPPEVLSRTADLFEDPQSSPHAWERQTLLEYEAAALDVEEVWAGVWGRWGPAPAVLPDPQELELRRAEAQRASRESHLHQLDLACRRVLGQRLRQAASLPAQQRAALAQHLNGLKRDLLAAARLACEAASAAADWGEGSCVGAQDATGVQAHDEGLSRVLQGAGVSSCGAANSEGQTAATEDYLEHWVHRFDAQCTVAWAGVLEGKGGEPG